MLIKDTRYKWFSDKSCFKYKISEVENKIPDTSSLVTTNVLNTNISEVENKIRDHTKYILLLLNNLINCRKFCSKIKTS